MDFHNWKIDRIKNINPDEFFSLINRNKSHIVKTFPVTVSNCLDLKRTSEFIIDNVEIEKQKTGFYFYVRDITTNHLIGYLGIKKIDYNISKCEIFYFVDKDLEGKGIISKAVLEVIDFCFDYLNMNKIIICTSKINIASQKIALKYNFIEEGILREEFKSNEGILEDIIYFGLLKKDHYQLKLK